MPPRPTRPEAASLRARVHKRELNAGQSSNIFLVFSNPARYLLYKH